MSEEPETRTPEKIVHDNIGRTSGDLLYSVRWYFFAFLLIVFFAILYFYFREVVNVAAVLAGFIVSGGIAYLVFPGAPYAWYLYLDIQKRIIAPIPIPVQDAQRVIEKNQVTQVFTDGTRAVISCNPELAVTEIHTISDLHLLASVTAVETAISKFTAIVKDYQLMKRYRGIEVSELTIEALENILASKGLSHLTNHIRGIIDELGKSTSETPEV